MGSACIFKRVIVLGLLATSSLGFLVTFAGYVGSQRYLEVASDYRPYQLFIGVIGLAVALTVWWSRVWPKAAIALTISSVVVVGVNAFEVLPVILASKPALKPVLGSVRLKSIAFNVEGANMRFAETRAWVASELPDVAMFCEANGRWKDELSPLGTNLPYRVRIEDMDIEVFSRHPVIKTQVFNFGPQRGFVAVDLVISNVPLTFVAVHAYPRHWFGDEGFRLRTATLVQGLGELSQSFARPLLIMGDLNASPWSPAYKTMIRKSSLVSARDGFGIVSTHSGHGAISRWLWRPIDHCLRSSDIGIEQFWTGPDLGSDHRPILANCILPGSP